MVSLSLPIEKISRISVSYQKKLKKLGIKTVEDLLFHFPHRYEDFSKIIPISKAKIGENCCFLGRILKIENRKTPKKKMVLTEAIFQDKSSAIKVIWFNQPYLKRVLKEGERVCLAGKIVLSKGGIYFQNPAYEKVPEKEKKEFLHTARIVPVYPETEGLSSRWLRYIIRPILKKVKDQIKDPLPFEIRKKFNLLEKKEALWQIHFPTSLKLAKAARERFSFEELFKLELLMLRERYKLAKKKAFSIPINLNLIKKFVKKLPFKLTDAQRKCTWQILKDLEKEIPMNRLLEGDVGSGKTIVATICALNVAKAGYQVAFMAPTEILAKQHFKEISKLLEDFNLNLALLTGKEDKFISKKLKGQLIEISRKKLLEKLEKGEIDILIGTHALIQEKVKFDKLALVILDEQHRFGVEQRAKLIKKKNKKELKIPHLLSMTATPIPRTLSLTIYGDLDLSLLNELPKGRKKVITKVIPPQKREKAYQFIRREVKKGRQVFVICPRIEVKKGEDLETTEMKAVKQEYEKLSKKIFPDLKIGMLHGKMKPKEKEEIMKKFKEGKIDILVSTSVVEVGIDVPKATVMMIEGAERFGLAQLHQFRGRVGRSSLQSFCFLFTDSKSKKTKKRLEALLRYSDGFKLAEKDLEIRGPGDLIGKRQWGLPNLSMEALKDLSLVEKTREAAKEILLKDPELKNYPLLKKELEKFEGKIHLE